MSGLLLFAWIMVLAVIIATIVIFFKNRKEKNEFDDFSWESEKRKEKKLFDRTNDETRYQVRNSNYEEQQYSNSDVENKLNDDKKYENNELCGYSVTPKFYSGIFSTMAFINKNYKKLDEHTKILAIYGTDDKAIDIPYISKIFNMLRKKKRRMLF